MRINDPHPRHTNTSNPSETTGVLREACDDSRVEVETHDCALAQGGHGPYGLILSNSNTLSDATSLMSRKLSISETPTSMLMDAVVLIIKNRGTALPPQRTWMCPSRRVFSLDAFLTTTGWTPTVSPSRLDVSKGAVFIHEDRVEALRETLAKIPTLERRKKLFVYPLEQLYSSSHVLYPIYVAR